MRELLGKALQEKRRALSGNWERPWEEITRESQENARACAEAVISKYIEILTPGLLMNSSSKQEMKLYAALDLSIGNKAVTIVGDTIIVIERVLDITSFTHQFLWLYSAITLPNGNGGPTVFRDTWHLGDELKKKHGIDYMEDRVWVPLEWSQ